MLPESFGDMQTFHLELNPSEYLCNIGMFTIPCHFSSGWANLFSL